jgi:pilus assembly protein FimV
MFGKRTWFLAALALLALPLASVHAGGNVRIGIGIGFPVFYRPYWHPVYVAPAPVVVAPAPVYVVPAQPVYVQPAPTVIQAVPAPAPQPLPAPAPSPNPPPPPAPVPGR